MKHVLCPVCGGKCVKFGRNKSGTQRWLCRKCSLTFTPKIDNKAKQLDIFLDWLFSKKTQREMPGEGRSFRRKTSEFWEIWSMPPKIEEHKDVVYATFEAFAGKMC